MDGPNVEHSVTITLPSNITMGDLKAVQGSLLVAATTYIDWEALHRGAPHAISAPGRVLLAMADQLPR